MATKLRQDNDTIAAFVRWLGHAERGGCTEVRVLNSPAKIGRGFLGAGTHAGFFRELEKIPREVVVWGSGLPDCAVYASANPYPLDLLARVDHTLRHAGKGAGHCGTDELVRELLVLPLDFDPVRPKGIPATDEELAAAIAARDHAQQRLAELGVTGARATSGNGAYLLVRTIGYPNTPENRKRWGEVLDVFVAAFSTPAVKLDPTMKNPSRIVRLFGTVNSKGNGSETRPWRLSSFELPEPGEVEPCDLLGMLEDLRRELGVPAPAPPAAPRPSSPASRNGNGTHASGLPTYEDHWRALGPAGIAALIPELEPVVDGSRPRIEVACPSHKGPEHPQAWIGCDHTPVIRCKHRGSCGLEERLSAYLIARDRLSGDGPLLRLLNERTRLVPPSPPPRAKAPAPSSSDDANDLISALPGEPTPEAWRWLGAQVARTLFPIAGVLSDMLRGPFDEGKQSAIDGADVPRPESVPPEQAERIVAAMHASAGSRGIDLASLAAIRKVVRELPDRAAQDPAAPFEHLPGLALLYANAATEWERCRAKLAKVKGVRIAEITKRVMELHSRRPAHASAPPTEKESDRDAPDYFEGEGRLYWRKPTPGGGRAPTLLMNCSARILAELLEDDGSNEPKSAKLLRVQVAGCEPRELRVEGEQFEGLSWLRKIPGAIAEPGQGTRERIRHAVQLLSVGAPIRSVYTHTGWRKLPGRGWVYLSAGACVGGEGAVDGVEVVLQEPLSRFALPAPPSDAALRDAVRASSRVLYVAPPRLTAPMLGLAYRAALGSCEAAAWASGTTGNRKSSLAALIQAHYGAEMWSDKKLPAAWSGSSTNLELLLFLAKDALLVVDEFVPTGSQRQQGRLYDLADGVVRSVVNRQGKGRGTADISLAKLRTPRSALLSTGEELPPGHSLQARLLVLSFDRGDVDLGRLSASQADAKEGRLAGAMSGFLRWVAPSFDRWAAELAERHEQERQPLLVRTSHGQTASCAAHVVVGLKAFVEFAVAVGAMEGEEADRWLEDALAGLSEAIGAQELVQREADQVRVFFDALGQALAAGRAHMIAPGGGVPNARPGAWGWRPGTEGLELPVERENPQWLAQGERVGWVDEETGDLWLIPDASLGVSKEVGNAGDERRLFASRRAFGRMLRERGALKSWDDARETTTVRPPARLKAPLGAVWHVASESLAPAMSGSEPDMPPEETSQAQHMLGFAGMSGLSGSGGPPPGPPEGDPDGGVGDPS